MAEKIRHDPRASLIVNNATIGQLRTAMENYRCHEGDFSQVKCAEIEANIAALEKDNVDLIAQLAAGELGTKPLYFK